jgi:hypothetical protein
MMLCAGATPRMASARPLGGSHTSLQLCHPTSSNHCVRSRGPGWSQPFPGLTLPGVFWPPCRLTTKQTNGTTFFWSKFPNGRYVDREGDRGETQWKPTSRDPQRHPATSVCLLPAFRRERMKATVARKDSGTSLCTPRQNPAYSPRESL